MSTPDPAPSLRQFLLGDAVCDLDENTLMRDGVSLRLEPRLAGLLSVLAQQAGQTISRSDLLALVWDEDGSDEALTQAISRLRRGLGDKALIKTVPRIGYQLTQQPRPIDPEASPWSETALKQRLGSRIVLFRTIATALAAGMAVAILVLMTLERDPSLDHEIEIHRGLEQEFEIQDADEADREFIPQDETP